VVHKDPVRGLTCASPFRPSFPDCGMPERLFSPSWPDSILKVLVTFVSILKYLHSIARASRDPCASPAGRAAMSMSQVSPSGVFLFSLCSYDLTEVGFKSVMECLSFVCPSPLLSRCKRRHATVICLCPPPLMPAFQGRS